MSDEGITLFICGGKERNSCSVPGCSNPAPPRYRCAYPLGGAKAGQNCDKPLCVLHVRVEPVSRMQIASAQSLAVCPAHQRRMRQQDEKGHRE